MSCRTLITRKTTKWINMHSFTMCRPRAGAWRWCELCHIAIAQSYAREILNRVTVAPRYAPCFQKHRDHSAWRQKYIRIFFSRCIEFNDIDYSLSVSTMLCVGIIVCLRFYQSVINGYYWHYGPAYLLKSVSWIFIGKCDAHVSYHNFTCTFYNIDSWLMLFMYRAGLVYGRQMTIFHIKIYICMFYI